MPKAEPKIDVDKAVEEFRLLKQLNQRRNDEYFLLRQAVKGNFRWPDDWPSHVPKLKRNFCKPITERHATFLMGRGFTFNVERPNSLEYRSSAEKAEKILDRLCDLSRAQRQFDVGALLGSQLGRSIYKVYKRGPKGSQYAAFTFCQPDYFYGVPAADDSLGDFARVYYSYPLDRSEAERLFGPGNYKTDSELRADAFYDPRRDDAGRDRLPGKLAKVPVLEVWTRDAYAIIVGGIEKFNGKNPMRWSSTDEGFIPFVVIENIRSGAGDAGGTSGNVGEADIAQARELNEFYNFLLSDKTHIVRRYLRPTLVWEGAPQNYAENLTGTLGGGGAIPTRLGSKLSFLTHDSPNPAVLEVQQELREAILETSGMTDMALRGEASGSIRTGPSTANELFPVTAGVERKRTEWGLGIRELFAMLLELQEQIGDSKVLGKAVVNQTIQSENFADGEEVTLSGKDIAGLRDVCVSWPGMLPKDDLEAANLEIQKAQAGMQSIYTTLEKLGEQYPDDEITRIRRENNDPALRGEKVAEQMRAATPLMKQQQDQEFQMQQQMMEPAMPPDGGMPGGMPTDMAGPPPGEELPPDEQDIYTRLRALQASRVAEDETGEPVVEMPELA